MAGRWAVLCAVAVIGFPPRGICRSLALKHATAEAVSE
jgi:hypothetical protein